MKSKKKSIILALTLGIFGAHRFYLGQTGKGLLCILLPCIGLIDGLIFGLIRGLGSKESFNKTYNAQAIQVEILKALKNTTK